MAFTLLLPCSMRSLVVAVVLSLATAAWAEGLETLRGAARMAEDKVLQLRATQRTKRGELATLSARIETLKRESRGPLSSGAPLDDALKASQELSATLSTLAQTLAPLEAERDAAHVALDRALSDELKRTRGAFDASTDRSKRLSLIATMRQLRSERATVRALMPVAHVPGAEALKAADLDAGDPEALLEQAELLRDTEAKVAKEMVALDARIAERRDELALEQRVQRFLGEESMFDDQDRRLRLQRTTTVQAAPVRATPPAGNNGPEAPAPQVDVNLAAGSPTPSGFANQQFDAPANKASDEARDPTPNGALDPSGVRISAASDARPQVGSGAPSVLLEGDDLSSLDAERARLQQLGSQLRGKAAELERRAATLKDE